MKQRWITVVLCGLALAAVVVRLGHFESWLGFKKSPPTRRAIERDAYVGLRSLVLNGSRENFGLAANGRATQPFAVVIDEGFEGGTTTIVAVADGSASVYSSNAAARIGGGQAHQEIHDAALKTVDAAGQVQPQMQHLTAYPMAEPGRVTFYAVTDAGVFGADVKESDLRGHSSQFAPLFDASQQIVAQYAAFTRKP